MEALMNYDLEQPHTKLSTQEAMRRFDQEEFLEQLYEEPPTPGTLLVRWMLLWMPWMTPGRK